MSVLEAMRPASSIARGKSDALADALRESTPAPPSSRPRTITELIQRRAERYSNKPIFGYPSSDGEYQEYNFGQLRYFSQQAAYKYANRLPLRSSSQDPEIVVALLALSNLDYLVTALALSKLGFTVLYLSTRISETAIISLLKATKCRHVVMHRTFEQRLASVSKSIANLQTLPILEQPAYDTDELSASTQPALPDLNPDLESKKISWIIHSSGSTGLPKPIYQTHSAALRNYEQNMDMQGFITLPLYHAHGLSSVFRSFTCVKKIYLYSCDVPLTSQNLLNVMRKTQFEIFYGVPYALKLLSESAEGVERLAAMRMVMFGGSACPDALGDLLVDGGVNLISHYGTTETGQLMTSARPAGDKAWNYVRATETLQPYIRWEPQGANLFELVVLDGWGSKVATNRPDGAYATKDIFEPHPSIPHAWKYSGRLDDTIVLLNGEKAVPVMLEQAVRQHVMVREAVMFGSGKAQLGMMIVASQPASHLSHGEVLEAIWPTVEKQNEVLPAYARLSKDMCRVLPADTSFPQTDKGTVIRQAFYRTFEGEIEKVYQDLESRSSGSLVLSEAELRKFIRVHVSELMPDLGSAELTDETDFFSLGMDSLQSMRFRGVILQHIQLNGHILPQNVVFDHPSINKLAAYLYRVRDGNAGHEAEDPTKEMQALIAKYSDFPVHTPRKHLVDAASCVLVTGATGSLGAHIVAQLAVRDDVSDIRCLVRAPTDELAQSRVMTSLKDRALYASLSKHAMEKITAHAADLSRPDLGLDAALYTQIANKATAVIHSAWAVNFNQHLSSFEKSCIGATHHLIRLCLSSPRRAPAAFNFCSSVSAVVNTPAAQLPVAECVPAALQCAQHMGYARSKLVTETVVQNAVRRAGLPGRVLRIGQVIADTQAGIWNATEAIPLMLRTAVEPSIAALPALNELARWLPVDVVAGAVVRISVAAETTERMDIAGIGDAEGEKPQRQERMVFNIVNPSAFHWTRDLLPALRSAGLQFKTVPQREWIRLLRQSDADAVRNPSVKLVEFFAAKYGNAEDEEEGKSRGLEYVTSNAVGGAPMLREIGALDQVLVRKFIEYFLKVW